MFSEEPDENSDKTATVIGEPDPDQAAVVSPEQAQANAVPEDEEPEE